MIVGVLISGVAEATAATAIAIQDQGDGARRTEMAGRSAGRRVALSSDPRVSTWLLMALSWLVRGGVVARLAVAL
jgi:hypothetical protein